MTVDASMDSEKPVRKLTRGQRSRPRKGEVLYSFELAEKILERVARGESIKRICKDKGMPSEEAWYKWLHTRDELVEPFLRAKATKAHWRNERIDSYKRQMIAGKMDYNVARVAIQAEQWQAAREAPKVYGDKLNLDGKLQTESIGDSQLQQRLAYLLAKQGGALIAQDVPEDESSGG